MDALCPRVIPIYQLLLYRLNQGQIIPPIPAKIPQSTFFNFSVTGWLRWWPIVETNQSAANRSGERWEWLRIALEPASEIVNNFLLTGESVGMINVLIGSAGGHFL